MMPAVVRLQANASAENQGVVRKSPHRLSRVARLPETSGISEVARPTGVAIQTY